MQWHLLTVTPVSGSVSELTSDLEINMYFSEKISKKVSSFCKLYFDPGIGMIIWMGGCGYWCPWQHPLKLHYITLHYTLRLVLNNQNVIAWCQWRAMYGNAGQCRGGQCLAMLRAAERLVGAGRQAAAAGLAGQKETGGQESVRRRWGGCSWEGRWRRGINLDLCGWPLAHQRQCGRGHPTNISSTWEE